MGYVEIKIGATNDKFVTVEEGLQENDEIVLNPRSRLELMKLPEIEDVEDREELAKLAKDHAQERQRSACSCGALAVVVVNSRPKRSSIGSCPAATKITTENYQPTKLAAWMKRMRDRAKLADGNRDGNVDRAELLAAMKKAAAQRAAQGGGPGGPGGPGGGGPGGPGGRWSRWTRWRKPGAGGPGGGGGSGGGGRPPQ